MNEMRCRLHNPYDDLPGYWVDWRSVEPLWLRNDFHPLDPATLKRAYHSLWFEDIDGPRSHFKIGAIDYNTHNQSIMFVNGRNRTILLSTLMSAVPLALDEAALSEPGIGKGLVERIRPGDILTLPNLPIRTYLELTAQES
jgi:hypothetical protein